MLSFLDAFSGYNQIKIHPRDECKAAFMTETCCYCYKVMSSGLKNAGATYQRLMDRILAPMLGRNVQAYVDDMVVTSQERGRHTIDLEELFATIAKYRVKLNPEKCVFGVEAGKFLGFLLTKRGIEANPDKCATIGKEESRLGEGGATVDRADGRSVQIRISWGRQGASLFPVLKEE